MPIEPENKIFNVGRSKKTFILYNYLLLPLIFPPSCCHSNKEIYLPVNK